MENIKKIPKIPLGKTVFLAGSGISVPSGLPSGMMFSKEMAGFLASNKAEMHQILKLFVTNDGRINSAKIRFEQLVSIFQQTVDPDLKILDPFMKSVTPNLNHFILAEAIAQGGRVFTTNFDVLIETAFNNSFGKNNKFQLKVACVEESKGILSKYSFKELTLSAKYILFKLHGTMSLMDEKGSKIDRDTTLVKKTVGATLDRIGGSSSVFRLEKYKHRALARCCRDKMVVVIGYSGLDDFDVVPSLAESIKSAKCLIWISHSNASPSVEQGVTSEIPKIISESLNDSGVKVYVVRGDTAKALRTIFGYSHRAKIQIKEFNSEKIFNDIDLSAGDKAFIVARLFQSVNEYQYAIKCYQKAVKCFIRNKRPLDAALAMEFGSNAYLQLGRTGMAFRKNKQAVSLYRKLKNKARLAVALVDQAEIHLRIGDTSTALSCCNKAKKIFDSGVGEKTDLISLIYLESKLKKLKGDVDGAIKDASRAVTVSRRSKYRRKEAEGKMLLSRLYREIGQTGKAMSSIDDAIRAYELLGHPSPVAAAYITKGNILLQTGNAKSSIICYHKALSVAKSILRQRTIATAISNIGVAYRNLGQQKRAYCQFTKSIQINKKIKNLEGIARDSENIGLYFMSLKKYKIAKSWFLKSLKINQLIKDKEKIAISLINYATCLRKLNCIDEALSMTDEAYDINRNLNRPLGISSSLLSYAEIHYDKGNISLAASKVNAAYKIAKPRRFTEILNACIDLKIKISKDRGSLHLEKKYLKEGLEEAIKVGDKAREKEMSKMLRNIS